MGQVGKSVQMTPLKVVGRYELFDEVASGGFAAVHLGRTIGDVGFARVVAIKRLHPQYAKDPDVSAMFLDEARIVARIRHPHVVPTLDLIEQKGELFLVMEYVEGVSLAYIIRECVQRKERVPLPVVCRAMSHALQGLHSAHDARDATGKLLNLVHRDVSPENIMVGVDGMGRILDFGVARAMGQFHSTRDGQLKGKLSYLTPEQVLGSPLERTTDVFAASICMWEALTGKRLFKGDNVGRIAHQVLHEDIPPPSSIVPEVPKKFDTVVMRGLERDPKKRWASAQKMSDAIEATGKLASSQDIARFLEKLASERLGLRRKQVEAVELAPVMDHAGRTGEFELMAQLAPEAEAETRVPPAPSPEDSQRIDVPPLPGVRGAGLGEGVEEVDDDVVELTDDDDVVSGANELKSQESIAGTFTHTARLDLLRRDRRLWLGAGAVVVVLGVGFMMAGGDEPMVLEGRALGALARDVSNVPLPPPAEKTAEPVDSAAPEGSASPADSAEAAAGAEPSASASTEAAPASSGATKRGGGSKKSGTTGWKPPPKGRGGLYGRE
jgi:serine/threonine-protein kinase